MSWVIGTHGRVLHRMLEVARPGGQGYLSRSFFTGMGRSEDLIAKLVRRLGIEPRTY